MLSLPVGRQAGARYPLVKNTKEFISSIQDTSVSSTV
jgi:hypothetical protein